MRLLILAASLSWAMTLAPTPARAQFIGGGESERGLRPGAYVPYDGMPYTQRYAYGAGASFLYFGGDARYLWYLDYLDRADRADKFGYRQPADPFQEPQSPVYRPARFGLGFGLGLFRR